MFKNWLKNITFGLWSSSGFSQKAVNSADDSLFVYITFGERLECSKIGNKRNLLLSKDLANVFDKV